MNNAKQVFQNTVKWKINPNPERDSREIIIITMREQITIKIKENKAEIGEIKIKTTKMVITIIIVDKAITDIPITIQETIKVLETIGTDLERITMMKIITKKEEEIKALTTIKTEMRGTMATGDTKTIMMNNKANSEGKEILMIETIIEITGTITKITGTITEMITDLTIA